MGRLKKSVGKYELGRTLGEGTFGKVKYAEHSETGEPVAIKVLDKDTIQAQNMGAQIKREVSVMKSMTNCPHVVQLREVLASKSKIYLVLELVRGGELFDEIVRDGKFTETKARFYFRQFADGLSFCHERGVSHRDLKPENLLLDEKHNLKISDFGLSALYTEARMGEDGAMMSRSELLHTTCGTPNYVAPEVLENEGYDGFKADVWSAGVVLFVLVTGCLPFDEPNLRALFQKIKGAEFVLPSFLSDSLKDLLRMILVADPRERMTLTEIRNHPWVCQRDDSDAPGIGDMKQALDETPSSLQNNDSWRSNSSGEVQARHDYRFLSKQPHPSILSELHMHLEQLCFQVSTKESARKLKAFRTTPRGMIGLFIEVNPREDEFAAEIVIRRGKGSVLEYNVLLNQLKRRLKHLIGRIIMSGQDSGL